MNFFNVYFIFVSALLINLSLSRRHSGEHNQHGYGNLMEALFGHNHGHRPGYNHGSYNHGHGLGYNHGGYYHGHRG